MPTTLTDASDSDWVLAVELDPRPAADGSAFQNVDDNPDDGFFEQTAYKGAFNASDLWLWGWSWLAENGKLTPAPTPPLYRGEINCGTPILSAWLRAPSISLRASVMSSVVIVFVPGPVVS